MKVINEGHFLVRSETEQEQEGHQRWRVQQEPLRAGLARPGAAVTHTCYCGSIEALYLWTLRCRTFLTGLCAA